MISQVLANGIARNLREFGYPDVTGQTVLDELAKPASEQGIIGMMAVGILEDNGLAADGSRLGGDV